MGSCDRDCTLKAWSRPSLCSQACDRGFYEMRRDVLVTARANGKCDAPRSRKRYWKSRCNVQACIGDEECISRMNLVIAIDGSGSISEVGFDILKTFVISLVRRLRSQAYGHEAVHVGVVAFGNGHLDDNLVVSDALAVEELTTDTEAVIDKVGALAWQRGFTNMAQAILKAKRMFGSTPRTTGENIVLLVSDGQPSFRFQTKFAADEVRESARLMLAHVSPFPSEAELTYLRTLVSRPLRSNMINIPGKRRLKRNYERLATKVLSRVCRRFESPSQHMQFLRDNGYEKVTEGYSCGPSQYNATHVTDATACHAEGVLIFKEAFQAFAYSKDEQMCYLYMDFTCTQQAQDNYDFYHIHAAHAVQM